MNRKELGIRLKELRKSKGYSQYQLVDLMGYKDHSTLAKVETGVNDITVETLYKYASILGVDISDILSINSEIIIFNDFCKENSLDIFISTTMPKGYENVNVSFDAAKKTLFYNADHLKSLPAYERLFYFFHELRHADQYLNPSKYSEDIVRSLNYSIAYDGTCSKLVDGKWCGCKLEGSEEYFANLYLNQPYEIDANKFAYEKVKEIFGWSEELDSLLRFWLPKQFVSQPQFNEIYRLIDIVVFH